MDIVEILEQKGRIELAELASLLLPDPVIGTGEDECWGEVCEEACEECEGIQEKCVSSKFRNVLTFVEVD